MKKTIGLLALFLAIAPGSIGTAAALPPLHLDPSCGYVFNPFTSTPRGFDAMCEQLVIIIQSLGLEMPIASWQEADLEKVEGTEVMGDGIPDCYQLAMLGAALCAGDPTIISQFDHNVGEMNGQISQILSFFNTVMTLPPLYAPAITSVDNWIAQLEWGTDTEFMAEELSWALHDTQEGIASEIAIYSTVISTMLPQYTNWFAAMGGLDSGLRARLDDLLGQLIGSFTGSCALRPVSEGKMSYTLYVIDYLKQYADPPMPQALMDQVAAIENSINNTILPSIATLHMPDMVIFGLTKAHRLGKISPEPFAADGDYNGDGRTNLETYELVAAANGDRFTFVQAAASSDPFWNGNPGLPVAGPLGLALLTIACAAAGSRAARRK